MCHAVVAILGCTFYKYGCKQVREREQCYVRINVMFSYLAFSLFVMPTSVHAKSIMFISVIRTLYNAEMTFSFFFLSKKMIMHP